MKKLIITTLTLLLTFVVVQPAFAQANNQALTRVQQVKQYANIEVVNTISGVTINLTGKTLNYSTKLLDIFFTELFKRSINLGSTANLTATLYPNGFSININSTNPAEVEEIQKMVAEINLPAKVSIPLLALLANHGIN